MTVVAFTSGVMSTYDMYCTCNTLMCVLNSVGLSVVCWNYRRNTVHSPMCALCFIVEQALCKCVSISGVCVRVCVCTCPRMCMQVCYATA